MTPYAAHCTTSQQIFPFKVLWYIPITTTPTIHHNSLGHPCMLKHCNYINNMSKSTINHNSTTTQPWHHLQTKGINHNLIMIYPKDHHIRTWPPANDITFNHNQIQPPICAGVMYHGSNMIYHGSNMIYHLSIGLGVTDVQSFLFYCVEVPYHQIW